MRRRDFISLLGAAVTLCSTRSWGQQLPKTYQIGYLALAEIAYLSPLAAKNSQASPISIGRRKIILAAFQLSGFLHSLGHERLAGASCRSSHVRNAPLATVGPKRASCRDGPLADITRVSGQRQLADLASRTLYAARGRAIPLSVNSPTGSIVTASLTAVKTRGLIRI
jgi:hypothetical protein